MAVVTQGPTLEQLQRREHQAWQTYAQTVFNPLETPEQREEAFRRAMLLFDAVSAAVRAT